MRKLINFVFVLSMLAIIVYPAWLIYQHPEWMDTPTPVAELPVAGITSSTFVATGNSSAPLPPAPATPTTCPSMVNAAKGGDGALNLRAGPGTSFAVIDPLADRETVYVSNCADQWCAVSMIRDGLPVAGFVREEYLEICK